VKRAYLVGGARDGGRLGFESEPLPDTLIIDGETYRLTGGRWPCYRHVPLFRSGRQPFDDAGKRAFVEAIAAGFNVERAAQRAGFSVSPVYRALTRDACFAADYAEARRLKREAVAA
jgi:predicted NBD/HSP70 family sugar kinase